jgi:hypothetical protein
MSTFNYSIPDLMRQAFGVTLNAGYLMLSDKLRKEPTSPSYNTPESIIELHSKQLISALGTPFYQTVILRTQNESFSGYLQDSLAPIVSSPVRGMELPNGPAVDVTSSITVVKTSASGSKLRGSVKETITADDYRIRIRGLLVNHDRQEYPIELVSQLNELVMLRESLEVQCELLNTLGIYNIVIEALDLPAFEFINVQPFTLSCVSDDPIELAMGILP